eukprot:PhM_4_TR2054/c3_g2_i2/m.10106
MMDMCTTSLAESGACDGVWHCFPRAQYSGRYPAARSGHSSFTWRGKLYIYGGLGLDNFDDLALMGESEGVDHFRGFFNDMWAYGIELDAWEEVQTLHAPPSPTFGHASTIVGDIFFVFGGQPQMSRNVLSHVSLLDMRTRTWRSAVQYKSTGMFRDCTLARWGTSAVAWTRKKTVQRRSNRGGLDEDVVITATDIIMFGGANSSDRHFNDVTIVDINAGVSGCGVEMVSKETMGIAPGPRRRHSAAMLHDRVMFISGGREGRRYYNDTFMLHMDTMTWFPVNCSMSPCLMHALAINPDRDVGVAAATQICEALLVTMTDEPPATCPCATLQPRTGVSSFVTNDLRLCVVMGFSHTSMFHVPSLFCDVHEFDLLTCKWRKLRMFPREARVTAHTAFTPDQIKRTREMRIRHSRVREKTRPSDDPNTHPIGRSMQTVEYVPSHDCAFLFGGRDHFGPLCDFWRMSFRSNNDKPLRSLRTLAMWHMQPAIAACFKHSDADHLKIIHMLRKHLPETLIDMVLTSGNIATGRSIIIHQHEKEFKEAANVKMAKLSSLRLPGWASSSSSSSSSFSSCQEDHHHPHHDDDDDDEQFISETDSGRGVETRSRPRRHLNCFGVMYAPRCDICCGMVPLARRVMRDDELGLVADDEDCALLAELLQQQAAVVAAAASDGGEETETDDGEDFDWVDLAEEEEDEDGHHHDDDDVEEDDDYNSE